MITDYITMRCLQIKAIMPSGYPVPAQIVQGVKRCKDHSKQIAGHPLEYSHVIVFRKIPMNVPLPM